LQWYFSGMSDVPDAEAITAESPVRYVHFVDTADSTNDLARALESDLLRDLPVLILAAHQIAGRGQHGNRWWSGPGSLTCSILVSGDRLPQPELVAVSSALAVASAIRRYGDHLDPGLKWPNDVLIDGKKVSGILIESFCRSNRRFYVIGVGVNTNCRISDAPAEIRDQAISLWETTNRPVNHTQFLIDLINQLDFNLNPENDNDRLIQQYATASVFRMGCPMVVRKAGGEELQGRFYGLGMQGQLRLKIGEQILELQTGRIVDYG
jgi:BirA family biotin operon repressor/biotin-[acetyl-CoA-carboxylase] ligase